MALIILRIALLVVAASITAGLLAVISGARFSLASTSALAALYFIPVNLLCLWILRWRLRAGGLSLRTLAGFDGTRLGRDILYGLLWQFVLFVPFIAAMSLMMLALFGAAQYSHGFEAVFAPDPASLTPLPTWFSWLTAILVALLFPLSNAPVEELYYRGYAQGRLLRSGRPAWLAILLPSLFFGLQHVLLAPTAVGMLVYVIAFLCWGAGAGIIYLRQKRLMPLIVAHFLTNAMTAVVPLVLLLAGAV